MELILLIILLIAYSVLKSKEGYQASRYNAECAREKVAKQIWMQRVTNEELEHELRSKTYFPSDKEEILEEMKRDGYQVSVLSNLTRDHMIRALMAKQGFLTYNDAFGNNLISYTTELDRQVLLWCDQKLRERNVPTRLVKSKHISMYEWEILM